jgi:hypothetical protein
MMTAVSFSFISGCPDGVNYTIKFQIYFPDYPIVHTRKLTTNKSKARAEGPMIVLRMER